MWCCDPAAMLKSSEIHLMEHSPCGTDNSIRFSSPSTMPRSDNAWVRFAMNARRSPCPDASPLILPGESGTTGSIFSGKNDQMLLIVSSSEQAPLAIKVFIICEAIAQDNLSIRESLAQTHFQCRKPYSTVAITEMRVFSGEVHCHLIGLRIKMRTGTLQTLLFDSLFVNP